MFYSENKVRHITKNHKFCPICNSEKTFNDPLPQPPETMNEKQKAAFIKKEEEKRQKKVDAFHLHKEMMQKQANAFARDKDRAL
jgi:hypothetical protein